MTVDDTKNRLKNEISEKRYIHSINVMEAAIKLSEAYGTNLWKARMAALLHDCARDIRGDDALRLCRKYNIPVDTVSGMQTELLHGPLGSVIAGLEYKIDDEEIKKAIYTHTTGSEEMSMLQKIVFIADYIEPGRAFAGVDEIRRLVWQDLDKAIIVALESTIKYVISQGRLIHPDTLIARNSLIINRMRNTAIHDNTTCKCKGENNQ